MGEVECLFKAVKLHLNVSNVFVVQRSICFIWKTHVGRSLNFVMQK